MKQEDVLKALGNIIRTLFPELGQGTHLPHKARVVATHGQAGEVRADGLGARRYSVDVEPLTPDGEPDGSRPYLLDVPLEVVWAGPERGVFALPAVGTIVRVCYYGGSAAHPYIDGIVPDGFGVPAVQDGELLLQHSPAVRVRILPSGEIDIISDQLVRVQSSTKVEVAAPLIEHAGGGAAHARVGDQVQVVGVQPGPATVTGTIITGSEKVFCG